MMVSDLSQLFAAAVHVAPQAQATRDTVIVASPLPGGVAAVVRFLLNVPQWVQIGGIVLGAIVAGLVAWWAWPRRQMLLTAALTWLKSRTRNQQIALAASAVLVLAAAGTGGAVSWHYTQHNNGFCTGCHVMTPAYQRFTRSEHDTLECHDCHQQPLYASMRQMALWIAERPEMIGKHTKLPNHVCERCHVTEKTKEVWQHIKTTAGHRTHLESDSSALRNVQCVTCHGAEVHHFKPIDSTCAQSGCHEGIRIKLGKMAGQTNLHCTTCHQFTADVARLATRDSAAHVLYPKFQNCTSCHKMQTLIANFDPDKDPHRGTCGDCHNPHLQNVAKDANKTCTSANCHINWRAEPFHTGPSHVRAEGQCTMCHIPHQAKVDPSDCTGCHTRVGGDSLTPPSIRQRLQHLAPFDTTKALKRVSLGPVRDSPRMGKGDVRPEYLTPVRPSAPTPAPPDSFPHARHTKLACLTCHTQAAGHGRLTFEAPRGCEICHHQNAAELNCATCHGATGPVAAITVGLKVAVPHATPRARDVGFNHAKHEKVKCVDCHTTPVTLAPKPEVKACTSCHDQHGSGKTCVTCHLNDALTPAHQPWNATHVSCDRCHNPAVVRTLVPVRNLCVTCHDKQKDHYADRECTVCHFQSLPEQFRARLTTGGNP